MNIFKKLIYPIISVLDKYTANELAFHWRKDHPLTFPNDFGDNGLAKIILLSD